MFTNHFRPGWVYRVKPEGALLADLAHDGNNAWRAESAIVERRYLRGVDGHQRAAFSALAAEIRCYGRDDAAVLRAVDGLELCDHGTAYFIGEFHKLSAPLIEAMVEFCGGPIAGAEAPLRAKAAG